MPFYQFGLNPNQKDDLTEYVLDYMQSTAESVNVGGDLVVKGNIEVDGSVTMPNLQLDLTTDEVEETTTKQYLTNSAQTIEGEKTFNNGVIVKDVTSSTSSQEPRKLSFGINLDGNFEIKSDGPVIEFNKQENTRMTIANSETVLWEEVVIANRVKTDNGQVSMVTHPTLTFKMDDDGEVNTGEKLGEIKFNVMDAGEQTAASIRAVATTAFSDAPPKEFKAPTKLTFHTEGNLVQEFQLQVQIVNQTSPYPVIFRLVDHTLSHGDVVDVDYVDPNETDTTLPGIWTVIYDSVSAIRLHRDEDGDGVFQEFTTTGTTLNLKQINIKKQELDKERLVIDGHTSTITMNDPLTVNGTVTANAVTSIGAVTANAVSAQNQIISEGNGNYIKIVAGNAANDIAYMDMKIDGGNLNRDARMSVNSTANANVREQGNVTLKCNSLTIANDSAVDSKTVNDATLNVPRLDVGTAYKFKSEATTFFDSSTTASGQTIPRYATRVVCSTNGDADNIYILRDAAEFISDHGQHSSLIVKRCGSQHATLKRPVNNNFYGTKNTDSGESISTDDFVIENNTSWVEFWPIPADPNRTTSSFFGGTGKGWLLAAGARLEVNGGDGHHP